MVSSVVIPPGVSVSIEFTPGDDILSGPIFSKHSIYALHCISCFRTCSIDISSFKKFRATAHHVNFNRISVFTTDNLEVHLVSEQVELNSRTRFHWIVFVDDHLPILPDQRGFAIAAHGVRYLLRADHRFQCQRGDHLHLFSIRHRWVHQWSREDLARDLRWCQTSARYERVCLEVSRKRSISFLAGSCCIPNCKMNCPQCLIHERCVTNCKAREQNCKKEEKGFFAEVRYLQLHGELQILLLKWSSRSIR